MRKQHLTKLIVEVQAMMCEEPKFNFYYVHIICIPKNLSKEILKYKYMQQIGKIGFHCGVKTAGVWGFFFFSKQQVGCTVVYFMDYTLLYLKR